MSNERGCEGDIAINRSPALILVELHCHTRSSGEIAGQVRVAYAPVSKIHPAISRRCGTPNSRAIFSIVDKRDIFQRKGGHTAVLYLQNAVLSGETTARSYFCPVHCLYQVTALLACTQ